MAVQTVGIEFNLDTADGLAKLRLFEAKLKELGIVADKINLSQIGEKMKLSATLASSDIEKLNKQIHELEKAIDVLVSKRVNKVTPYKELTSELKLLSKATRDQQAETAKLERAEEIAAVKAKKASEDLVAMRVAQNQKEAKLSAEYIASWEANLNKLEASAKATREKVFRELAAAPPAPKIDLYSVEGKTKAAAEMIRQLKEEYALKKESLILDYKETGTLENKVHRVAELNRLINKEQNEIAKVNQWLLDQLHTLALIENKQRDVATQAAKTEAARATVRPSAPIAYSNYNTLPAGISTVSSSSSQLLENEVKKLQTAINQEEALREKQKQSLTTWLNQLDSGLVILKEKYSKEAQEERNRVFYHKKFLDDLRNADLAASKLSSTEASSKRIALLQALGKEEEAVRLQNLNKITSIEERKALLLKQLGEKQEFALLKEGLSSAEMQAISAKYEKLGQYIINRYKAMSDKVRAETARIEENNLRVGSIKGYQQNLQAESDRKLALLEAGYAREKAVRDRGENSIQAQQAKIAEKRLKTEDTYQKKLTSINELVEKGTITQARAEERSRNAIKHRQDSIDVLNKEAAALQKTQSAHMNLTSFIGTSMIIWQSWNYALTTITSSLQAIPKVGMELDSTISVLKATMGGSAGAAAGLRALDEEAGRTGINIVALRENWRTFSASTVVAGETMETSWKIFSQVNTVITALHYSADKATGIFMALSQIFNKSKVQSEELVKQLGNLLPAAFAVFAKAQGMSTMELSQQMKKGLVFAHDTVAKFTAEYEKMFSISFANASKSLNAEVGRMQNEFIKLGEAVYKITEKDMVAFVKKTGEVVSSITPTQIENTISILKNLGEILAYVFGAKAVAQLILWSAKLVGGATAVATATRNLSYIFKGLIIPAIFLEGFNIFADKMDEKNQRNIENTTKQIIDFSKAVKYLPQEISIKVLVSQDENVIKITDLVHKLNTEIGTLVNHVTQPASDRFFSSIVTGLAKLTQDFNNAGGLWGILSSTSNTELMQKVVSKKNTFKTEGFPNPILDKTYRVPNVDEKTGTIISYVWGTEEQNALAISKMQSILKKGEDLKLQAEEEAKRKSEVLNVKSYVESDAIRDKFDKLDLEKIKDKQEKAIATEELAHKENLALLKSEQDKVAQTVVAATAALALAEKDYAEASSKIGKEAAAKTLKEQRETLILRKADLEVYQQRELSVEQAHQNKLEDIKQQYAKKDEELAKKQIELAKKTAADLKEIADQTAERELQAIDKKLKALEKIQDERSIGDYHREEIKLIDEKIAALDRQLVAVKALNAEQQVTTSGGVTTDFSLLDKQVLSKKGNKDPIVPTVMSYLLAKGLSKEKASAFTATGLAESGFQTNATSGDGYAMRGMFQWDTNRRKTFKDLYKKDLAEATLKEQIDYGIWELTSNDKRAIAQSGKEARELFAKGDLNVTEASKAMVLSERPKDIAGATAHRTNLASKLLQDYSGVQAGNLDSFTTANGDVLKLEKEKQALEEQKLASLEKQSEQYKQVQKDINNIHAEYKLYTGEIEKGTEELFAEKHSKLIERLNLELKDLTITQEQYNETLKAKNELDKIGEIQAKQFASEKAMRSLTKGEKSIDKQLATISQMESLNLLDPISAMMQRSDKKSNSLVPNLQNQLKELQGRDQSIMPEEKKAATIAAIDEIQSKLLELSATANESFTFTANMVSGAFDTTFRGLLDKTIKGKDMFKEFGKSLAKTMQDLVLQAIKSQIVGLILKGLGSIGGNLIGGVSGGLNTVPTFSSVSPTTVTNSFTPFTATAISANGNLFNTGNIVPFSNGGIPDIGNRFQTFQMSNGAAGSLREQGKYEAIMPLKRTASGELGIIAGNQVASSDQRQYNINVNVTGGADSNNASDIGHKIAIATMEKIADTRIANASRVGNSQNRTTAFGGR
jgi:tape measure domain-containing protein